MAFQFRAWGLSLLLPVFNTIAQTPIAPTYEALTNAVATGGSFQFSGPGTIVVPSPVSFGLTTTLDANGHAVIFSGGGQSSILRLETNATLTLKGLALVDGLAQGSEEAVTPGHGGAILNVGGDLTLQNCVLSNNMALGATNKIGPVFGGGQGPQPVAQPAADAAGGAIWQIGGRLTIENSRFYTNGARSSFLSLAPAEGGAIYIKSAEGLEITETLFLTNSAFCGGVQVQSQGIVENLPAKGGAIYAEDTPVRISGGEVALNSAHGGSGASFGGGIYQKDSSLTVTNAIVSYNACSGGSRRSAVASVGFSASGGAIFSDGELAIANSALLENESAAGESSGMAAIAPAYGGAISGGGSISVVNSTIAGNRSLAVYRDTFGQSVLPSEGGAIYSLGTAGITNSTIVGHTNSLSPLAGGSTNTIKVKNTLFAHNRYDAPVNPVVDAGHNLSSDGGPQLTESTSTNGVNPKLGPIGLYGGTTWIYPLMAGSPAINAADDSAAPSTDQRGRARPFGAHADIGAFESSPPYFVWGRIRGYVDPSTTITAGNVISWVDVKGGFLLGPLSTGEHTATLSATNAVFRPNPWLITSDADRELSEVKAFELHTITVEREEQPLAYVLSGNPGEVWNVDLSADFTSWTEYGPFTIPNTGLTNVPAPANAPLMFMRGSYSAPTP